MYIHFGKHTLTNNWHWLYTVQYNTGARSRWQPTTQQVEELEFSLGLSKVQWCWLDSWNCQAYYYQERLQFLEVGMNYFRIIGDLSHYAAIVTIFLKIITSQSCKGISGKTQILYLLVFLTRYIDIFFNFISIYNTSIKIFFIVSSSINIYLVFIRYKGTISSDLDSFRIEILIGGAAVLSLIINHEFSLIEIAWTFSGKLCDSIWYTILHSKNVKLI